MPTTMPLTSTVHRARAPGVVVRPLPDLEVLLAFSPTTRTLHWLNLGAWALFELCDGTRGDADLAAAYAEVLAGTVPAAEMSRQITAGLESLEKSGLITQPQRER
jgi:hypothetical protein